MNHESGTQKISNSPAFLHFFAGGSVGALLGLCMGLSISPVVATVLAALGTSLVALLGLKDSSSGGGQAQANSLRVLGFGVFAVVCIGVGLLIRTHSWLSPSLASQRAALKEAGLNDGDIHRILLARELGSSETGPNDLISKREELKEAGFSDADARTILLYRELGLGTLPAADAKTKSGEAKGDARSASAAANSPIPSVLFAMRPEECQKIDPQQFENVDSFLASLKNRKGKYAKLAAALEKLNPKARATTAQAFYEFSCE